MSPPRKSPRPCRRPRGSGGRGVPPPISRTPCVSKTEPAASHRPPLGTGKPAQAAAQGKQPPAGDAKQGGSREKAPQAPLCRAKREPHRGVPHGAAGRHAAGARQGQAPPRAQQPTRPHADHKEPSHEGGRAGTSAGRYEKQGGTECGSPAPAGGGRFRKPPSRGRPTSPSRRRGRRSREGRGTSPEQRGGRASPARGTSRGRVRPRVFHPDIIHHRGCLPRVSAPASAGARAVKHLITLGEAGISFCETKKSRPVSTDTGFQ